MSVSLPDLESRRATLLSQFGSLGDLRSGSISNTVGRCGKSNCRCHRPGQPPHGPNARLTYKVQGKTLNAIEQLMRDAVALDRAGVSCIYLEGIPREVAAMITNEVDKLIKTSRSNR